MPNSYVPTIIVSLLGGLALPSCAKTGSSAAVSDAGVDNVSSDANTADIDASIQNDGGTIEPKENADAIAELRRAVVRLDEGWRFAEDSDDVGNQQNWFANAFDDAAWQPIAVNRHWEEQGHEGYDGIGWYRIAVDIPAEWQGSKVLFKADGIDDEYDLFVNGTQVAHYGTYYGPGQDNRSVFNWQTRTQIDEHLRYGERNVIAVRVVDWGANGGIWRSVVLRRSVDIQNYAHLLPEPILDDKPAWLQLYWAAWQMAFDKVSFGSAANRFTDVFIDEGFNEQVYQWDSSFMALFARYGARLFPAMDALDNFYNNQRDDGYIQRVYSETTGNPVADPSDDEPMVNPPLFSWVEWEYARTTGDTTRLQRVFPILERYYYWIQQNVRDDLGLGLYYQTQLGSGMDNTPRGASDQSDQSTHRAGWIDMSSQQALAATYLARIAGFLGDSEGQTRWQEFHDALVVSINTHLWNEEYGAYFDIQRNLSHTGVRHLGAYWALLADVANPERAARFVDHLSDPTHFYRTHLFPTLSAADPAYSPAGHYWLGGVWAPTNYMTIRGLAHMGFADLAVEAAENHIHNMARTFVQSIPGDRIAPEEADGDYRTIWECYAPDSIGPATRWDGDFLSRQDFVGWSGLGPIALLIEQAIGIDVDALNHRVTWRIHRLPRHGIKNIRIGSNNTVSLVAGGFSGTGRNVFITATDAFTLELRAADGRVAMHEILAGQTSIRLDW